MLLDTATLDGYASDLASNLKEGDLPAALKASGNVSTLRAASVLMEAPRGTVVPFFRLAGWEKAASLATYLPREFTARLLGEMEDDEARLLIAGMPYHVIADVLDVLPEDERQAIKQGLDADVLRQVETIAAYPDDSAGSIMSPYYLAVPEHASAHEAVDAVRYAPADVERGAYIYVVDAERRPVGVVSLRDLTLARARDEVSDLMTRDVMVARVDDAAMDAARRVRSRRLKLLPVVDGDSRLVGVITINQAMDLLAHEAVDEVAQIHAVSVDETFFTPPAEAVRRRLPWMAANIFLNLGAVVVITSFEETLVQVAILAAFLPMITDMGGNVGIQALSVSIRSIALGEVRLRDFWLAVRKELFIGICNGIALGALFTVVAYVMQGSLVLGLVAGTALAVNVLVAGVVGGTIPFLIKRIGRDPAMMTGPVLTTITDITGVSIYLGLCTVFLTSLLAGG
ncbi:magnesium transporter [Aquisalimonas asiatica]|uniref:Magnesium transporter MgtE n=1 Tax=Aquisalimonas asiatica TaxID=406100 RepID=A0A1H8V2S5_9GAMM|nr:magnesium transporter [Aquisalimonas asiatica]SEP09719.1 magnesium transporter [Aquisalimonas asiatica]